MKTKLENILIFGDSYQVKENMSADRRKGVVYMFLNSSIDQLCIGNHILIKREYDEKTALIEQKKYYESVQDITAIRSTEVKYSISIGVLYDLMNISHDISLKRENNINYFCSKNTKIKLIIKNPNSNTMILINGVKMIMKCISQILDYHLFEFIINKSQCFEVKNADIVAWQENKDK